MSSLRMLAVVLPLAVALAQSDTDARVSLPVRARSAPVPRSPDIQLDVRLVLIPATVTDPIGMPVTGLRSDAFRVFEDGVEQKILYFSTEDAPASIGLIFDSSRSMERRLEMGRAAISKFLQASMPEDEFFLVEFNDRPRFLTGFTRQTGEIEEALMSIRADGWTSLYDAIYVSINRMRNASNSRRALLVLSDGGDNNSRYNETEIRSLIREADVCIYTIGVLGAGLSKRNLRTLSDLAENTGGRLYTVEKADDLPETIHKISSALRNQYVIGYVPSNDADDGRYRKIDVRLAQPEGFPPLRASWRMGYYAPDGH